MLKKKIAQKKRGDMAMRAGRAAPPKNAVG
jgi:hypothetical protein